MISQTIIDNLVKNGFEVITVSNGTQAKDKVLSLIPEGSEVMTMSSVTLDSTGISAAINESGKFNALRPRLYGGDESAKPRASVPEFSLGSVHAVTEAGQLVIASKTGSQLPAYVYGAKTAIFVVGNQKFVPTLDTAFKRINEEVLPLEDDRAMKAYGQHSAVNKLLIINKEIIPGRIKLILIDDKLGF